MLVNANVCGKVNIFNAFSISTRSPADLTNRTGCHLSVTFKVIQGRWSSSNLKERNMQFLLVINSSLTLAVSLTISEMQPFRLAWNFPLIITAKPLETETWLLLTAYRKSPAFYPTVPTVPSPTPTTYRLATTPLVWRTIVRYDSSRLSMEEKKFKIHMCWTSIFWSVVWVQELLNIDVSWYRQSFGYNSALRLALFIAQRACVCENAYQLLYSELLYSLVSHRCLPSLSLGQQTSFIM